MGIPRRLPDGLGIAQEPGFLHTYRDHTDRRRYRPILLDSRDSSLDFCMASVWGLSFSVTMHEEEVTRKQRQSSADFLSQRPWWLWQVSKLRPLGFHALHAMQT